MREALPSCSAVGVALPWEGTSLFARGPLVIVSKSAIKHLQNSRPFPPHDLQQTYSDLRPRSAAVPLLKIVRYVQESNEAIGDRLTSEAFWHLVRQQEFTELPYCTDVRNNLWFWRIHPKCPAIPDGAILSKHLAGPPLIGPNGFHGYLIDETHTDELRERWADKIYQECNAGLKHDRTDIGLLADALFHVDPLRTPQSLTRVAHAFSLLDQPQQVQSAARAATL